VFREIDIDIDIDIDVGTEVRILRSDARQIAVYQGGKGKKERTPRSSC
jgi:hypothetical protein